jgi:hypothetical protein
MTDLLAKLGDDYYFMEFTSLYLNYLAERLSNDDTAAFPVLTKDSIVLNGLKPDKTLAGNHSGPTDSEIRLIYAFDRESGRPIFYKPIAGKIIDMSALKKL